MPTSVRHVGSFARGTTGRRRAAALTIAKGMTRNALVPLVLLTAVAGCGQPAEAPSGPHFAVMTYNVNFGMPGAEQAVAAIDEADCDIVCLQETTPAWEKLLRARLGGRYPHMDFRHWRGAGGQAVLAKRPFREIDYRKPLAGWFPGWLVEADTPTGAVQVLNVHLRPPLREDGQASVGAYFSTFGTRKDEVMELLTDVDANRPAVVAGDFNESESAPAIRWAAGEGLSDALSRFDPHSNTWRWRVGSLTVRRRFDHILHSPHLHCLDARVLQRGQSDHLPVVATFQAQPKPPPATTSSR